MEKKRKAEEKRSRRKEKKAADALPAATAPDMDLPADDEDAVQATEEANRSV